MDSPLQRGQNLWRGIYHRISVQLTSPPNHRHVVPTQNSRHTISRRPQLTRNHLSRTQCLSKNNNPCGCSAVSKDAYCRKCKLFVGAQETEQNFCQAARDRAVNPQDWAVDSARLVLCERAPYRYLTNNYSVCGPGQTCITEGSH